MRSREFSQHGSSLSTFQVNKAKLVSPVAVFVRIRPSVPMFCPQPSEALVQAEATSDVLGYLFPGGLGQPLP